MHSNSLVKHFCHIIHPTVLLRGPDILLLVSNWSQNFYQCSLVPLASPYIFKDTFLSYDSVNTEGTFHLKECAFRNDFTPIVCLFRARASVPQATICSLASPSAMQKNRSLNATIQLLVGTATEITHATRQNLSAEQGCRKRVFLGRSRSLPF